MSNLHPMIVSGIAMQADLTRAITARKDAAGLVNETEYKLYVTMFTGAALAGITQKTKELKAIKTALAEAGRSERNIESVVTVICNGKLRKKFAAALAAPAPLDAVFAAMQSEGLNSVTSLRRAAGNLTETDKLSAIQKAYGKLDDEQRGEFAAWLAAGAVAPEKDEKAAAASRVNALKTIVNTAKAA